MFGREGLGSVPDMVPPVGQVESSDQLLQLSHLYPAVCGSVLAQPLSPPFPLSPACSPGALTPLTQGSDPKWNLGETKLTQRPPGGRQPGLGRGLRVWYSDKKGGKRPNCPKLP